MLLDFFILFVIYYIVGGISYEKSDNMYSIDYIVVWYWSWLL